MKKAVSGNFQLVQYFDIIKNLGGFTMFRYVSILLGILLLTSTAFAQNKIGVVDMQRALNESKEGMEAKKEISKKANAMQSELKQLQQELDKLKTEMEKQVSFMSEEAKAEKEKVFQKKLKEFQTKYKDAQEELQQKDAEYTKKIIQRLEKILQKIGEEEKYTVILEKNSGGIFYYDKAVDLTDLLVKKANEDTGKK